MPTNLKPLFVLLLLTFVPTPRTQANPTLIVNVHGYTLADDRLKRFSGLAFEGGKVLASGNSAQLRKRGVSRGRALALALAATVWLLIRRRRWPSGLGPFVVLAGLLWQILIDSFDAARAAMPRADWLEIRYEDVAAKPAEEQPGLVSPDIQSVIWVLVIFIVLGAFAAVRFKSPLGEPGGG